MKVTVVVFGLLRDHLPDGAVGNRATIELDSGATVSDVAAAISAPAGAVFASLIDGQPATGATPVADGSEVTLMPAFSGGADDIRGVGSSDG